MQRSTTVGAAREATMTFQSGRVSSRRAPINWSVGGYDPVLGAFGQSEVSIGMTQVRRSITRRRIADRKGRRSIADCHRLTYCLPFCQIAPFSLLVQE
jgi:hypothetical protein